MDVATLGNAAHLLGSAIPVSSIVQDFDDCCLGVGFADLAKQSNFSATLGKTADPAEKSRSSRSSMRISLPKQEYIVPAPLGNTFPQAQPSKKSALPSARREVDSAPSDSSILIRIHNLLNSIEEAKEATTDEEFALRRLAQSTRGLLQEVNLYHERSLANLLAGSGSMVDCDWMRQLLLIVYSELSKLWCESWTSKCNSDNPSFDHVQRECYDLDEYLSGDPWEGNADLATEGLLEWFTDSLETSQCTKTEDIKSVPVEDLLCVCWAEERKKNMEGDNPISYSNLSVASASPFSSTDSLSTSSAKSFPSSASTASTMTSLAPLSSNTLATGNVSKAWGGLERIACSEVCASGKNCSDRRSYAPMPTFSYR